MQPDPVQLMEGAQQGDRAAAIQLIELFYEKIYAFLRRLAHNESDAADLTQKAFARIWRSLPSFAGRSSVSSWLHSIAYHTYVDWRRADNHAEHRPETWWSERICPQSPPDETVAQNDLAAKLCASVDGLEPELRDTVHLHYYQELTLQETADAMGVSTGAVKYRLRQALTRLESLMSSEPASPQARLKIT